MKSGRGNEQQYEMSEQEQETMTLRTQCKQGRVSQQDADILPLTLESVRLPSHHGNNKHAVLETFRRLPLSSAMSNQSPGFGESPGTSSSGLLCSW